MILDRVNNYLQQQLYQAEMNTDGWMVLEAGGGSFSHFALPDSAQPITLDIDLDQLQRNQDVALRVCGDLHALPIAEASLDMIICFNVIEHLDDPETALAQLNKALKPGGILLLGCPNLTSLKGVITKYTPIQFHRWYYRTIVKKKDRGGGHFDAFPTPFRSIVRETGLQRWLQEQDYQPLMFEAYDGAKEYNITVGSRLRQLVAMPYYAVCKVARWLSLGRLCLEQSDILLIARKN